MEGNVIKIDNNPDKAFNVSKIKRVMKHNPWMISTSVLSVVVVVLLFMGVFGSGFTGKVISSEEAGSRILNFAKLQGAEVTLSNVTEKGSLYEVVVLYQGQELPLFITKDGEYLVQGVAPLNDLAGSANNAGTDSTQQPATELVKSDKPSVELYVFTYCPYGTQSEKGIIPVVKLLGSKIDFKIRQIGAMHGEYEKIEAQRQLCIEKEFPTKFLDYVLAFALDSKIGACGSNAKCSEPLVDALYTKLGINKAKIEACMKTDSATLYATEEANSKTNGVSGSPTLIINGAQVNSGRDSASYLKTICGAFNSAPAECSQTLSSASPSAGFGDSTTTAASSGAQC